MHGGCRGLIVDLRHRNTSAVLRSPIFFSCFRSNCIEFIYWACSLLAHSAAAVEVGGATCQLPAPTWLPASGHSRHPISMHAPWHALSKRFIPHNVTLQMPAGTSSSSTQVVGQFWFLSLHEWMAMHCSHVMRARAAFIHGDCLC